MVEQKNAIKMLVGFMMVMGFCNNQFAFADWSIGIGVGDSGYHHDEHAYYHWHDHPHYGYRTHFLPEGAFVVWVDGARYFYYDGLYYMRDGDVYELVSPPIGAYVSSIPPDFQPVSINGRIYYTDGGVYYLLTEHHGYKVVPTPVVYQQPQQVIVAQPAPVVVAQPAPAVVETAPVPPPAVSQPVAQDSFPINIPNNSGGYTTVVIKKSGNGYVGPQGEYYANFPSVTQLKAMYVK